MNTITSDKLLQTAATYLKGVSDVPFLEGEMLLMKIKNISREHLLINHKSKCSRKDVLAFAGLLKKRARGIPIAYLIGKKEFYNFDFKVSPDVLIPRPESELLIDGALTILKDNNTPHILDVGTGSGCLAITLAKLIPPARIIATDVSKKALDIARLNAARHKVTDSIIFLKSNLLQNLLEKKYDIIIANLPYLPLSEALSISSKYNEPKIGLNGGEMGFELYAQFIKQLKNFSFKYLLLEIDPRQSSIIQKIIKNSLSIKRVQIIKDLAGRARILKVIMPSRL